MHLAQDERGPLGLGQGADVCHEQSELLAPLHLIVGGRAVVGEVNVHGVRGYRLFAPELVQTAVASNPVEPGTHVNGALVGDDRLKRGRSTS